MPEIAKVFGVTINQLYDGLGAIVTEEKQVLCVSVEDANTQLHIRWPLDAVRFFFQSKDVWDLDEKNMRICELVEKMLDSKGTFFNVAHEDKKVKIRIESYED